MQGKIVCLYIMLLIVTVLCVAAECMAQVEFLIF